MRAKQVLPWREGVSRPRGVWPSERPGRPPTIVGGRASDRPPERRPASVGRAERPRGGTAPEQPRQDPEAC